MVETLKKRGYKILKRNFHSKFGEIDIIALKDDTISFFEVKYSKNYNPIEKITPAKIAKISRTIDYFFMKFNYNYDYQISAVLVTPKNIEILENITI